VQSLASAVLAPSLRMVADSLALEWRKQLTRRVHGKYLMGTNFYAVSQLAGLEVPTTSALCDPGGKGVGRGGEKRKHQLDCPLPDWMTPRGGAEVLVDVADLCML